MPCKRYYESEKSGGGNNLCPLFNVPCVHPETWWPWSNCRLIQASLAERPLEDLDKEREILVAARARGAGISFEMNEASIKT